MKASDLVMRLLSGAAGGFVGSGVMAVGMDRLYRLLPRWQQYDSPPRIITRRVAQRAGLEELVDEPHEETIATGIGHFGYGAAAGALYALAAARWNAPPILKGGAAALIVWAVSYLGWLPALNILPPATEHPRRRTAVMIAGHLLWGVSTAWIAQALMEKGD
jgi:uncharacterized membrane protein YagU involved in acid resistance